DPSRVLRAEPPRGEVSLIPPDARLEGVFRAAPVGTADLRAVPDEDRESAAQEDALVALAAVPPIQKRRRGGAVPHHEVDPPRVHRNLVIDVAVIAVKGLCIGVTEDRSTRGEGALLLDHDGCTGSLTRALRHHVAGRENGQRATRQKTHTRTKTNLPITHHLLSLGRPCVTTFATGRSMRPEETGLEP